MDWKELRDGSLRIEQHLITHKQSQRKILVGKKGSKIGYYFASPWFLVQMQTYITVVALSRLMILYFCLVPVLKYKEYGHLGVIM